MDKIKTSELISKLALASEEACKCEDENFLRVLTEKVHKKETENVTYADVINVARVVTDFLVLLLFVQYVKYYKI